MSVFYEPTFNVFVYDTQEPRRILDNVPGSKPLVNGYVAVPASLYNTQLLRWAGLPVLPPMTDRSYHWPIRPGRAPLGHQRAMANFLAVHPRCFNLSDMGTMKTTSTLWAADYIMRQHEPGTCRAIVVCPISTMQRVWGDTIFRDLMGERDYAIVYGSPSRREKIFAEPHDFYIINYDGLGVGARRDGKGRHALGGLSKSIAERTDIRIAIIDEASAYRAANTKRHKIARGTLGNKPYLWCLTGTPTPKAPTDAYGLAKLVNDAGGESFNSFKNRTLIQVSAFKWVPRADGYAQARALLSPAIRFETKDCMELPPCSTQQRDVPFSAEQETLYKTFKRDLVMALPEGRAVSAANEAVLRMKLIQISCGAIYDDTHKAHFIDASPRVQETLDVIEQSSAKCIVFAPLTSVVHMLSKELGKHHTVATITGEVKSSARNEIFRAFQDAEDPRVIVADPGTMSHGLDLFAAATIIWYAPTDKTETYLQANKRIDRPGQVLPTTIVQLASNAIEREIYKRLENNESLQGVLLKLVRGEME